VALGRVTSGPGKLTVLANLLGAIKTVRVLGLPFRLHWPTALQHTDEKCIVVSHYTSTLNIVEAFCKKKSYSYLRLDG